MTPNEIDRAIDALTEGEYSDLCRSALARWNSKVERYLLVAAPLAIFFLLCIGAARLVSAFWPGSIIAATIVTVVAVGALWLMIKFVVSFQSTDWLLRRAIRRQFSERGAPGAP